ncbi:hypothetical protein D9V32_09430 [Mycetocola tolaasinivorans]|uniref:Uncharacterized protein n=1 Tax=Mycetocola tolaasinivorans TaxID=76635 RepID=A0A3L7A7W3_9MICO|nr:hypothetical protein [Mycetocola tolaasinivorans]RLP75681.1 hypothetical protein D9V32_09430 [Mycetocola tolaasinivorans]
MRISLRRSVVAGTTLLLAVGLSACSTGPSVADACATTNKDLSALVTDAQNIVMNSASDPAATAAGTKKLTEQFTALEKKIENEDVKKAVAPLGAAYAALDADVAKATADSSNTAGVLDAMEKFLDASKKAQAEYRKVCAA